MDIVIIYLVSIIKYVLIVMRMRNIAFNRIQEPSFFF